MAGVCAVGIGREVAFIPRAALRLPWATLFNAFGVKESESALVLGLVVYKSPNWTNESSFGEAL